MYGHRNLVLSAHPTSQKIGKVDGKKRIVNQKERRVPGATKSKNSKRSFLVATGKGSRPKAWTARECAPKTSSAIARLKTATVTGLIEPMMKRKKAKAPKKPVKKKKEEDVGVERGNLETHEDSQVFSPKKGQKKKNIEKKRKRSKGDSDVSDEEAAPQNKKKRGPRTPPLAIKEELADISTDKDGVLEDPLKKENTAFSDWSDEDVPDRTEGLEAEHTAATATPGSTPSPLSSLLPPPPPVAAASTAATALASSAVSATTSATSSSSAATSNTNGSEDSHRKCHRARGEKVEVSHVTLEDTPHRKLVDQKRSSSLGSNRSHRSHTSGRLRSPSNDSAHRSGDDQGSRKRVLHSGSRDREKTKSLEITGERKSRIDQLKRGEPSRSTSSDRQDSRSHSSRRSSPESDRQVHSRSGSFDSRDRLQERDRYEHDRERERDRRDPRQREWDREAEKEWPRTRDRDRLRERDRDRDRRRDLDRERERLISDPMERDRERERTFETSQLESGKRSEVKLESEHERDLEGSSRDSVALDKERMDRDLGSVQGFEDVSKAERTESLEGDDESKLDDAHSLGSGAGEGYEPISDDELDEILAGDAEKREDQQEEEKMPDPLDVIDVDWSGLMPKHPKEPREPGAALLKFTPGAVLLRVGISKKLAGSELFTKVKETCQQLVEKPKDADSLFEHELGALNMAALLRKEERASLLSDLGPCCKALCFRRDSAIRKQLVKNEKGTVKQAYTNTPMVDNELLRLSLRLFKKKATCHAPGQEKTEDGKLGPCSIQQELCVS